MRYWEEQIAQYRADQKGYEYAKDKANYYAELKGVEGEIKHSQEQIDRAMSRGVIVDEVNLEKRGDTSDK